jgi:uncharacterized Tic20 family protein
MTDFEISAIYIGSGCTIGNMLKLICILHSKLRIFITSLIIVMIGFIEINTNQAAKIHYVIRILETK